MSRTKWLQRRFDHSAIFLLIAATYTPFVVDLGNSSLTVLFLIGMWSVAVLGILIKLLCPGRFERTSIGFCLLMGWSGLLLYEGAKGLFPPGELRLVIIGGALYTFGLVFHLWQQLRFQNAISVTRSVCPWLMTMCGGPTTTSSLGLLACKSAFVEVAWAKF
ncbi:hemolysin III family protein [Bradyrhizobium sp. ARR65]|uniref:PAQR family membrane homeostasis protein TrhA n=1 Tax=Bradyrhizobium sp. ARR65 TaxID=1040989 RepID=UPI00068554A5|nr:hemolysin III family protein [Bradyrhizobium sp. ARR65]